MRGRRRRRAAIGALVLAGDLVALAVSAIIVGHSWLLAGAVVAALAFSGSYRHRLGLSALDVTPQILVVVAVALLPVVIVDDATGALVGQAVVGAALLIVGRASSYAVVRRMRARHWREPTVIAGSGVVGAELGQATHVHPEYGCELIGYLGPPGPDLGAPILGGEAELESVARHHGVTQLIVAFGPTREAELVDAIRTAAELDIEVFIVPRYFEVGVAPRSRDVDDVWGIPLYRMRQSALRRGSRRVKRALDAVSACLLLVLLSPLLALGALAVRLSSGSPVLFRQNRVGQNGREFEILKFRTLPVEYSGEDWGSDVSEASLVGRILRRTGIDELPQLWNVARGDMSLIGPRPERGEFVEQFSDEVHGYRARHRLPVGITGFAQVHGLRGDTSLHDRARFDNYYIEHWSLWLDFKILIRTAAALLSSGNRLDREGSDVGADTAQGPEIVADDADAELGYGS